MRRLLAVALSTLLLAACGDPATAPPGQDEPVRVAATATALQQGGDVPQLCHFVMDSYPPQCSGIPLDGADLRDLDGMETASGVTWGIVRVAGVYDGERIAVSSIAPAAEPGREPGQGSPPEDVEREEIWRVQGDPAFAEVQTYARGQGEFAGLWWDAPERPTRLVVAFTGRLDAHEAALRERWPHELEVVEARYTFAQLEALQERINQHPGLHERARIMHLSIDERDNRVTVGVELDDARTVAAIREAAGDLADAVVVDGWLETVED